MDKPYDLNEKINRGIIALRQENAMMRALLEEIELADTGTEKPVVCIFCDADVDYERGVEDEIRIVTHQPDCFVSRVRALLAPKGE